MPAPFTQQLLKWNKKENKRSMPWKGEKDPYKIWLSEIILQQTRVEQGLDYYNRFIKAFPTVKKLAAAPEQKVFKLWEGLGYYSRCKNLIATAKIITEQYKGRFPNTYNEILQLKGVGPYTAAAIGSFAFNLPYAVLDGNVFRVLARYFGISTPTDSTDGKKLFSCLAQELLAKKQPADYNQALMDFGATICKPQQPLCTICYQKKECRAFANNWMAQLPVKEKKVIVKKRCFYYFVFISNMGIAIKKRTAADIWQNLYEFALVETNEPKGPDKKNALLLAQKHFDNLSSATVERISVPLSQKLSHQTITAYFITIRIPSSKALLTNDFEWVPAKKLTNYPFPKTITGWLAQSGLF
ncbi:MAG: hypothetical protein RLZZ316_948 [Bacteroidota bacterium]|jgi:A/G-specific adenine glycosylase